MSIIYKNDFSKFKKRHEFYRTVELNLLNDESNFIIITIDQTTGYEEFFVGDLLYALRDVFSKQYE